MYFYSLNLYKSMIFGHIYKWYKYTNKYLFTYTTIDIIIFIYLCITYYTHSLGRLSPAFAAPLDRFPFCLPSPAMGASSTSVWNEDWP